MFIKYFLGYFCVMNNIEHVEKHSPMMFICLQGYWNLFFLFPFVLCWVPWKLILRLEFLLR